MKKMLTKNKWKEEVYPYDLHMLTRTVGLYLQSDVETVAI